MKISYWLKSRAIGPKQKQRAKIILMTAARLPIHMHFTPTSASWVNLVERFFRDITEEQIRRGVFRSVDELKTAIMQYLKHRNANPKPYHWTAKPEGILAKAAKAKEKLGALHRCGT